MIGGSNLSCLIGLSHLTSTLSDEMILADVSARQLSKAPEGRAWSSPSTNSKPTKKSKGPPFHLVLVGNAGKTKKPYEIPRILRYLLFSEFTKCQKAFRHRHSMSDIRCPPHLVYRNLVIAVKRPISLRVFFRGPVADIRFGEGMREV